MSKKLVIGITDESSVTLLIGQLAHFKSLGYKTYLLAPESVRCADFCKSEGCIQLKINIKRDISVISDILTLIQILKHFRKIRPNIVNMGTPKISLLGMLAAFFTNVTLRIYTCRGLRFEHEKGLKRWILVNMEKITSLLSNRIICISNSVLILGLNNRIFKDGKAVVIAKGSSNGVDLRQFNNRDVDIIKKQSIASLHGLVNVFIFGYVGRIVDRKGINELFEVFCELYNINNNLRFLLVGRFELEQLENKKLKERILLHPGVISVGRVDPEEVPLYLSLMNVFVLPAWWEGFGNVLIQAAAMGVPVISTVATGTRDAVKDGFNGLLVPIKNKELLKKAMEKLLLNENLRVQMGENGIEWAKNFDQLKIWSEMHLIYQS